MTDRPPCRVSPELFDSVDWRDHVAARQVCATCPAAIACLNVALDIARSNTACHPDLRAPDGTWGGVLWVDGHIVTNAAHLRRRKAA